MATITIKIESEQLAREVLTQLGYLPSDDVPDLISVVPEDEQPEAPVVPEDEQPEAPVVPEVKEPRLVSKPESSRDAFAKDQINKVLVSHGLLPPVPEEVWCPEPNDEGFGTPIDHIMREDRRYWYGTPIDAINSDQKIKDESMEMLAREKEAATKRKLEKKDKTQKDFRAAAAMMKERLTHSQYLQFLEAHESDPNIDPDLKQVAYQLILHEKAKAQDEATKEAALKDEGYRNYIENVEPISYEDYLKCLIRK